MRQARTAAPFIPELDSLREETLLRYFWVDNRLVSRIRIPGTYWCDIRRYCGLGNDLNKEI